MELRHLRAFRVVARTSSFTKAAAELHYAQSSVTEQVQALESELGTPLFERSGRKLQLTDAGRRLIAYADQVLLLVDEARTVVEDVTSEPSGELVVTGLETLCVHRIPAILSSYRARHPQVHVSVRQGNRKEVYEAIRRGDADVGFTFGKPLAEPALVNRALYTDRLVFVVPPDHRLVGRGPIRPSDLRGEPILATAQGCVFREMLDGLFPQLGQPEIVAEVTSPAALCNCVASGLGCALLPETAVESHAATGRVGVVPIGGAEFETRVLMTWLRRRDHKRSLAAFADTAYDVFGTLESQAV